MLGRTHLAAGALAGEAVAVAAHAGLVAMAICAALGMASAWLPDLDMAGSGISHALPLGWLPGRLLKHRGVTHSLLACAVYAGIWAFWIRPELHAPLLWAEAAVAGLLSHLVLDGLTGGVALFWPLPPRRLGVRLCRTGGLWERIAVFPGLLVMVAWSTWHWG